MAGDGRPSPSRITPWALTCAISPRARVRVADRAEDTGGFRNAYRARKIGPRPPEDGRPWAVYLADEQQQFRLVGLDLDAGGPVAADQDRLRGWLHEAGLPHVVCASGPGGGRHVWLALAEPVPAEVVARMARALAHLLPSLDTAPLLNPYTGCLRPPGAPHRTSGTSQVLDGDLTVLTAPTITAAAFTAWIDRLPTPKPASRPADNPAAEIKVDAQGHPYLPGRRRALSARIQQRLDTPWTPERDASRDTAAILVAAARAHWRYEHIAALAQHAPGLESLRTHRADHDAAGHRPRRPRTPDERRARTQREWRRAVALAATTAPLRGDDDTFETRCTQVVDAVAALQRRADAAPGRWTRQGGPADRRVLDQLSRLALTAVDLDVEADIRRLAMATALGRETVRVALHRLTRDGCWITTGAPAQGVRAAHWQLPPTPPGLSTPFLDQGRSQGATRPQPARPGPRERRASWLAHLEHRCQLIHHDVHTHRSGLPPTAGLLHQQLRTADPAGLLELADRMGLDPLPLAQLLDRLGRLGLAEADTIGRWRRPTADHRDRAAHLLGATGTLADRAARYTLEREAWAWWRAELAWIGASAAVRRRHPDADQPPLPLSGRLGERGGYGPHPTSSTGRRDFAAALAHLRDRPAPRAA